MYKTISFRPGCSSKKKPTTQRQFKTPTLADAPGKVVNNGLTIEWAHGNSVSELTAVEMEAIKRETGHKSINTFRILQIKNLMRSKTCAQIVAHFRGRKGYSERTIKRYHAALSKVGGGVK